MSVDEALKRGQDEYPLDLAARLILFGTKAQHEPANRAVWLAAHEVTRNGIFASDPTTNYGAW